VSFKIDPRIDKIVQGWPVRFDTPRALSMGFKADPGIEAVNPRLHRGRERQDLEKRQRPRLDALARGRARRPSLGSSKELCAVNRARPSLAESNTLNTSASSLRISGK